MKRDDSYLKKIRFPMKPFTMLGKVYGDHFCDGVYLLNTGEVVEFCIQSFGFIRKAFVFENIKEWKNHVNAPCVALSVFGKKRKVV